MLAFAEQHRDVIARFGCFPGRSPVPCRPSTEAEREFLASGAAHW